MPTKTTEPALADPDAREFLRRADPVMARMIDAHPDFRPRAWTQDLPALDAFSTLIFQVLGQQLSVRATRTILGRLEQAFGGRLPPPAELLAADPAILRSSGMSTRKAATLREIAQRFVDGRLSDEALSAMSDEDVIATLTEIPGIGPWTARGFLLVALDRPDVFLTGDVALRRADRARLRVRPSPDRRGDARARGALATVSEPRGQLPVRLRVRRTNRQSGLSVDDRPTPGARVDTVTARGCLRPR